MDSKTKVSYTSDYKGEEIIAFCYIYKLKDEGYKCLLTDQNLVIILDHKENEFNLKDIQKITLESRFIMLPLLLGGIVMPFSLLALFTIDADPWIMMTLFVLGGLGFYQGWLGHPVITVTLMSKISQDLKIRYVSEPLRAFIKFANEVIKRGPVDEKVIVPFIYHIVPPKELEELTKNNKYLPLSLTSEGFIHCSTKEQLKNTINRFYKDQEVTILVIDPLKVKAEVKYEPAKDAPGLFPHIYGPLNMDAVVKTMNE